MNAVEITRLTKSFGRRMAVDHLSLSVRKGEIFSLLGMNGAGKTTTLRILCGLLPADSGSAVILNHPAGSPEAKALLGLSPQETAAAENLTVRENLEFTARIHGMDKTNSRRAAEAMIERMSLSEAADRRVKKLSGGWQRRLSVAMALIPKPEVLILDEPTLGLDVLARRELWQIVESLRGKTTVVLTTHYLEEAEALSDRIAVMADGRIHALGTAAELKAKAGVESFEDAFIFFSGKEENA